jgi:hypothetical protein
MDKDKDLDNLFRRGFEEAPGHPPDMMEDDWDAMEAMLDKGKKRRGVIYWLPIISSVAALLLIAFGIWLFKPEIIRPTKINQSAAVKKTPKDTLNNQQQTVKTYAQTKPDTIAPSGGRKNGIGVDRVAQQSATKYTAVQHNAASYAVAENSAAAGQQKQPITTTSTDSNNSGSVTSVTSQDQNKTPGRVLTNPAAAAANNAPVKTVDTSSTANTQAKPGNNAVATNDKDKKIKVKTSTSFRPQYAISVLGSSDLNGLNSFEQSKVGTNVGAMFSATIFKRLIISTGAIYSSKPYLTNFDNYNSNYKFRATPTSISADCRMFDVPLNIDYNVYNKHRNKFSIGTGISSYLMFHENYEFSYASGSNGPAYYNVPNPGKYYLSILNLQATYQRQINAKFGLDVQPYMKLPLSGVGLYNSRLQSTGMAVGVTWNLGNH